MHRAPLHERFWTL